jgi:hypothetical protein
LAYSAGYEQVFLNGVLLSRSGSEYTATNGTSITLASATVAGDIVEVICPLQIATTDTYTQSAVNNAFQANTNNFAAGKNKIINGDFGVWQRGTSFSSTGYTADRFAFLTDGSGATRTVSRQALTAASISGYESNYFLRINQTVAGTGQTFSNLAQPIEDITTLAGKTVTLSFWAKADSNRSIGYYSGYSFGTGGSASIQASPGAYGSTDAVFSVTTSWQRFTATWTMPSISGKTLGAGNSVEISIAVPRNTTFTLDIWGVQLETGSNATAFQTATGTIQGELAACQRYYWRINAHQAYTALSPSAFAQATTVANAFFQPPVSMRVSPTSIDYSGIAYRSVAGSYFAMSSVTIEGSSNPNLVNFYGTISGATANQGGSIYTNNNASGYLGFSAEL